MEGIQVSIEKAASHSGVSIIRVGGYIDTTTSSELERALDSLLKSGVYYIVIDLGNVDYISSAGWGIFISEIKGIRERGGDLKLARMIPDVYEVFELLEFNYILKSFNTVEDALADFGIASEKPAKKKRAKSLVTEIVDIVEEDQSGGAADEPERVEDKIRKILAEHPGWGAAKVSKELNTERYDFTKMSTLGVWKLLRRLNLGGDEDTDLLNPDNES
ncbi:STAS domain-containing protein [bacterium]|nr:STAS domain-containing protein [bacterium]